MLAKILVCKINFQLALHLLVCLVLFKPPWLYIAQILLVFIHLFVRRIKVLILLEERWFLRLCVGHFLLLRFLKRFVSAFFVVNSFFIHVEVRVIDCPVTCVKTVQFPFLVVPPHLFFTRQDLRLLGLLLSY